MTLTCQGCGAVLDSAATLHTWEDCNFGFNEIAAQPYTDAKFSAGFVSGHPVDTMYLRFERDGQEPTTVLLRPDEMAAVMHVTAGVLWSHCIAEVTP